MTRVTAAMAALAATASLAGCAQGPCDFEARGACVEFTYDTGLTREELQQRVERLLDLEMAYWGVHNLEGWKVQFRSSSSYLCYFNTSNDGCTNYFSREMSVRVPPDAGGCFESAELLHELGHYTLGDPTHSDPKWRGVDRSFAAVVWDRPDAPEACRERYHGVTTGMWPVTIDGF